MNELGIKIKQLRKEKHMTQEVLAKKIRENFGTKTDRAMVSKWETGFQVPEMYAVACLAKIFKVSIDYLSGTGTQLDVLDSKKLTANDRELTNEENDIINRILQLSPENLAKLSELIDLYKDHQEKNL